MLRGNGPGPWNCTWHEKRLGGHQLLKSPFSLSLVASFFFFHSLASVIVFPLNVFHHFFLSSCALISRSHILHTLLYYASLALIQPNLTFNHHKNKSTPHSSQNEDDFLPRPAVNGSLLRRSWYRHHAGIRGPDCAEAVWRLLLWRCNAPGMRVCFLLTSFLFDCFSLLPTNQIIWYISLCLRRLTWVCRPQRGWATMHNFFRRNTHTYKHAHNHEAIPPIRQCITAMTTWFNPDRHPFIHRGFLLCWAKLTSPFERRIITTTAFLLAGKERASRQRVALIAYIGVFLFLPRYIVIYIHTGPVLYLYQRWKSIEGSRWSLIQIPNYIRGFLTHLRR